jgi:hypothetical protein
MVIIDQLVSLDEPVSCLKALVEGSLQCLIRRAAVIGQLGGSDPTDRVILIADVVPEGKKQRLSR